MITDIPLPPMTGVASRSTISISVDDPGGSENPSDDWIFKSGDDEREHSNDMRLILDIVHLEDAESPIKIAPSSRLLGLNVT